MSLKTLQLHKFQGSGTHKTDLEVQGTNASNQSQEHDIGLRITISRVSGSRAYNQVTLQPYRHTLKSKAKLTTHLLYYRIKLEGEGQVQSSRQLL